MPANPPLPLEESSRRSTDDDLLAVPTSDEHAAQLRRLRLFLRQATKFRLAVALYNDPVVRNETIRALAAELLSDQVRVLTLDLHDLAADEATLLRRVEALIEAAAPAPGERLAVMVVNLETRVDYTPETARPGSPGLHFLETANLHRDLFPDVCPGPLVLWVSELLENALVRHAPDLWRWRSHRFDLRTRHEHSDRGIESDQPSTRGDHLNHHPEVRLRRLAEALASHRKLVRAGYQEARADEGWTLNSMGITRLNSGDAKPARRDFEEALAIAREIGDRYGECNALANLGLAYADLGELDRAIEFHEQNLIIAREIGDRRGEGSGLSNLGLAHAKLGNFRRAIEFYEQALAVSRALSDRQREGNVLGNLADAYANLNEPSRAVDLYKQSMAIFRALGDLQHEGIALGGLGNAYAQLGELHRATEFQEKCLAIAREVGNRRGEGIALLNSARNLYALGRQAEAIACAESALTIFKAIESPHAAQAQSSLEEWR